MCPDISIGFYFKFRRVGLTRNAERPASPAAHSTHQARRLADEGNAIRGRVHAVVRCRPLQGDCPLVVFQVYREELTL